MRRAFTLVELLVVIAIIGILAALTFPGLSAAKSKAQRTTCLNNLRQVNLAMRLYCDDSEGVAPRPEENALFWTQSWSSYRRAMRDYVGLKGSPSGKDRLFACPSDAFYVDLRPLPNVADTYGFYLARASLHEQTNYCYSSYAYNGGISNFYSIYTNNIGIGGRKFGSVREPAKTVLVMEVPAMFPYSWHQPGNSSTFGSVTFNSQAVLFTDAKNMIGFVDGHVSYIKIYWNPGPTQPGRWAVAMNYDPPPGYDYKWSGD